MNKVSIKVIANNYLDYSLWFIKYGVKIHEEKSKELRILITKLKQDGFSNIEANKKAFIDIASDDIHPNQENSYEVDDICNTGNSNAFKLIKEIVKKSPNEEDILDYIGAGLFENWIQKADYKKYSNEIARLLETEPKWHKVIMGSWHNPMDLEIKIGRNRF